MFQKILTVESYTHYPKNCTYDLIILIIIRYHLMLIRFNVLFYISSDVTDFLKMFKRNVL